MCDISLTVVGAKQFYESIFDCHRESIENEIRKFVKEFEVSEKIGWAWVGTERQQACIHVMMCSIMLYAYKQSHYISTLATLLSIFPSSCDCSHSEICLLLPLHYLQ